MVAKDATESGREVYKPRPQVTNNDRVRSEVGETESGNAGINPNSNIYLNINNEQALCFAFVGTWICAELHRVRSRKVFTYVEHYL